MSSYKVFPLRRTGVIIFSIASLVAIVIVVIALSIPSTPKSISIQEPELLSWAGEEKTMSSTRDQTLDIPDKDDNMHNSKGQL